MQHEGIHNRSAAKFWDSDKHGFDRERRSLQSCSLFQDRKILSLLTRNLLCSVIPLSGSIILTHSRKIPLSMHRQFINSCLSCTICFFTTNSSQFFNFLTIFCLIFLEESIPHFLCSTQNYLLSLSLIMLQSLRFEFSTGFMEGHTGISLFSISYAHFCLSLR